MLLFIFDMITTLDQVMSVYFYFSIRSDAYFLDCDGGNFYLIKLGKQKKS